MPAPKPLTTDSSVVIVTTANHLRQIVGVEVERAVERALAQVSATRDARSDWVNEREAQRLYGRSRSTLARWRKAGMVPHKKIGGSVYYLRPSSNGEASLHEAYVPAKNGLGSGSKARGRSP